MGALQCGPPALTAEELLAVCSEDRVLAPSLKEGWLRNVSYWRKEPGREVFVRLTADALAFYELARGTSSVPTPEELRHPTEVVLLCYIKSALGRCKDRVTVRSLNDRWWQLCGATKAEVEPWMSALDLRLKQFRHAQRRSIKMSVRMIDIDRKNLVEKVEASLAAKRAREEGCFKKLGRSCLGLCTGASNAEHDFSKQVRQHRGGGSTGSRLPFRGSRSFHSAFLQDEALAQVTDADLHEAQAAHWSDEAVALLRICPRVPEDLYGDFKHTVRKGVPDSIKRLIWSLAVGTPVPAKSVTPDDDIHRRYANTLSRAFGSAIPEEFEDPVPLFSQGYDGHTATPVMQDIVQHLQVLTPVGQKALRRLLWVVQLTSFSVQYCPFLPNLMATLLPFFDEAETMMIVGKILSKQEDSPDGTVPAIVHNKELLNAQAKMFVRNGKKQPMVANILAHLEELGLDLETTAVHLLQDGLASTLPFRGFCRLVGSYLLEGAEVITRFAFGVLKLKFETIMACSTRQQAEDCLKTLSGSIAVSPEELDTLTKTAYSFKLDTGEGGWYANLSLARTLTLDPEFSPYIFCRPRLFEPRGKVPDSLWEGIWGSVPEHIRIHDPHLIYDFAKHGMCMRTCLENCKKHQRSSMFFFLYDPDGNIIGGFSPTIWLRSRGYLDITEMCNSPQDAFTFRKLAEQKTVDVFFWKNANNYLLQASETTGLHFGDGAIVVNTDFSRASTAASDTFGCPQLLEHSQDNPGTPSSKFSQDFELRRFEVFALY